MNKTLGIQLIIYSLSLAGLAFVVHHIAGKPALPVLIVGAGGGVLCMAWGLRSIMGSRGKALPILTLIAVNFTLLSQTFMAWSGGGGGWQGGRVAAMLVTLLFALSLGMLVRIAWAGVVFDVAGAQPTKKGADKGFAPGGKQLDK